MPDPVISRADSSDPEREAILADSVAFAVLVVLETLSPAERLAFVLHDMFDLPFEEIAPMVGRSVAATRQLASRARRRVQAPRCRERRILLGSERSWMPFVAAGRAGDFDALVRRSTPTSVRRSDVPRWESNAGPRSWPAWPFRGARLPVGDRDSRARERLAGALVVRDGRVTVVIGFTIAGGKIIEIDVFASQERLKQLRIDVASLDGGQRLV